MWLDESVGTGDLVERYRRHASEHGACWIGVSGLRSLAGFVVGGDGAKSVSPGETGCGGGGGGGGGGPFEEAGV